LDDLLASATAAPTVAGNAGDVTASRAATPDAGKRTGMSTKLEVNRTEREKASTSPATGNGGGLDERAAEVHSREGAGRADAGNLGEYP
jgi:hypothetical protein